MSSTSAPRPPGPPPTPATIRRVEGGSPTPTASSSEEERESLLRSALQSDAQQIANNLAQAQVDELRQTQALREKYAGRVFWFLVIWVAVAISFLALDALNLPAFDIEKQVMMTFLGGTTVAVVGLVLAVVKGLFPSPPKS